MATVAGGSADRIALANEPPFRLGALHVTPAWRQVRSADDNRTLEPRVMQVLVALAQAKGGIVSRDELVARCWDGRIVGENAINRVISILRALAAETKAFEIETITKVGYRLKTNDQPLRPGAPPILPARQPMVRRAALAGLGAAAIGGAAYLLWPDGLSSRRRDAERHYRAGIDSERLGDPGLVQALAHYRAAARADPDYAPAWGATARALVALIDRTGDARPEALLREAGDASRRALRLDSRNADALLAQVQLAISYRNWAGLQRLAEQALAVSPGLALARIRLARSLADTGRNRDAVAQLRQALRDQPLLPGSQAYLAWLSWQTGHGADARRILDWADRTWPDDAGVWGYRTLFLSFTGKTEEAVAMTDRNRSRSVLSGPLPPALAARCARALSMTANNAQREAAVEAIRAARRTGDIATFIAVMYLAALGDIDAAFEYSYSYLFGKRDPLSGERQPVPADSDRLTDFLFSVPTAPMRADPRFPKLTAAIGLDNYWRATVSRPDYRAS